MRVYLDHNAGAPLRPAAAAALREALSDGSGNASSVHWAGARARAHLERARGQLAALLGVEPAGVHFTSGATESNHAALLGAAPLGERDELLTCAAEHSSLLAAARAYAARGGRVRELGVDAHGRIEREAFARALSPRTRLVSIMWANNETGALQPIGELAGLARAAGALFHSDVAQALGKVPLALAAAGVDLASCSAHKLGGPQGVGALYVRPGLALAPLLGGGDQERGRRAGTENVAGIAGFGAACAAAGAELAAQAQRLAGLRERLWQGLCARVPRAVRHGLGQDGLPHVLHVSFPGAPGDALVEALDLAGIAASSGSACHAGSSEPSHVLLAMGVAPELARCALRLSLGPDNRAEEIDWVLEQLPALVARVRAAFGGGLAA